jgi:hypothetical protein
MYVPYFSDYRQFLSDRQQILSDRQQFFLIVIPMIMAPAYASFCVTTTQNETIFTARHRVVI